MKIADNKTVSNQNVAPKNHIPYISTQIGKTIFLIGLYYAEKGEGTLNDKLKHIIAEEVCKMGHPMY